MGNPYLGFQCCLEVGDALWFSSFLGKGLFRWREGKTEHVLDFEEEDIKLFNDIKFYRGKLYFVPMMADKIYVYDLEREHMESIPYGSERREYGAFVFSILHDHYLYMFPSFYPGILKLDMDTCGAEIIDSWISEDFKKCQISGDAYFRGDYARKGDVVYLPLCNAHAVLEFRLDNGHGTVHDVGDQGHATIAYDGEKFWMAPRNRGNVVRWDAGAGNIEEYGDFPEGFQQGAFLGSFYRDGYVWIFPETANMVLKVNSHTGEITEDARFSDFCHCKVSKFSVWQDPFIYIKKDKGEVLLYAGKSSKVVRFYPDRNEIMSFQLKLSGEDAEYAQVALLDICAKMRIPLEEYWGYTLEEYIENIGDMGAEEDSGSAILGR